MQKRKVEPTITTLEKIAKVFEISISELLKENKDIDIEINLPLLEKVKLIDTLEEKEKQSILTIIDMAIAKKRFKENLTTLINSD